MNNYPSRCLACGELLTSEEFGGILCFVCQYLEEFEDPYDEEEWDEEWEWCDSDD